MAPRPVRIIRWRMRLPEPTHSARLPGSASGAFCWLRSPLARPLPSISSSADPLVLFGDFLAGSVLQHRGLQWALLLPSEVRCLRTGLTLRHVTPERVLHSNQAVAGGELVETRAPRRKIPPGRLLSGNRRLTVVNLLIPLAR
jgi:hypothetical protein